MTSDLQGAFAICLAMAIFGGWDAQADHCPDELLLGGTQEHILAGVDVTKDRVERVMKLFGKPDGSREFEDSGEAQYTWSLRDAELKVIAAPPKAHQNAKTALVEAILVKGRSSDARLRSGRGVGLGATRDQVKAAYGSIYLNGALWGAGPDATTITFCFEDESGLEFTFDEAGRVLQVYLAQSSE